MAKWYGKIGFADSTTETSPGVWKQIITEKSYYGELLRYSRSSTAGGYVNDDINISNEISILADPFANENINNMKYAEFGGNKWRISSITVEYPRLRLSLGGLYND